ncbi:penicillin-binding transpeptidase domain-containing protein [Sphingomonas sp. HDW15A]|uniref:penicillin-binding transpeptidase domain-containing protein n=1 Tax=Sphingomonas sp. HDW15A TaxID=2714942 RepID=UPI001F0DC87A|nr:penicillin-binding transpeptidase domain-containing protein [Sphingomonas sp. HDW15A]
MISIQPGHPGPAAAGQRVQAVRLSRRPARRLLTGRYHRRQADHHRRLDPGQQRRRLSGGITLREAFARSSNAAAVRLSERVGRDNVLRAARELGIRSPLPDSPSVALGTAGVSLLELTSAYAAIASGRYPVQPTGLPIGEQAGAGSIDRWFARGGHLDQGRDWAPMLDLLWASANEGTGRRAALGVPTYGKTGTTQNNRDAIFVGFAGNLVVGVWVGRDDDKSLGKVTGGTAPAQIWRRFMSSALAIDGRRGPPLPYRPRYAPKPDSPERQSPLPEDWSEPGRAIREVLETLEKLLAE